MRKEENGEAGPGLPVLPILGVIPADHLVFDPSLRKYCEDNLLRKFWERIFSCPPACGTPEEMKKRTEAYETALIFQTIAEVDWHDAKALKAVSGQSQCQKPEAAEPAP